MSHASRAPHASAMWLRGRWGYGDSESDDCFFAVVPVVLVCPPSDRSRSACDGPGIGFGGGPVKGDLNRGDGVDVEDVLARGGREYKGLAGADGVSGSKGEAVLPTQLANGVRGLQVYSMFALRGSRPPSFPGEGPVPMRP